MLRICRGAVYLLGLGTYALTFAQDDESFSVDVAACIDLESEEARFACYEERVNAARTAEREPAADRSTRPQAVPPASTPAEQTLPEAASASRAEPAQSAPARTPRASAPAATESRERDRHEIFGTISALRETIPNQFIITLDNGQVWRMDRAERYPLRVGLDVMLYDTRWGSSYRLTAPEHGGFVTVERVD